MAPQAPAPVGFENATQANLLTLPGLAYAANTTVNQTLPKVGYLSRINLEVVAAVTMLHASNTAATKSPWGPFNLIKRVRVLINNLPVVDISGYGLAVANMLSTFNWRGDQTGAAECFAFGNVISAGGAANDIVFNLQIPIALNDRDLVGLIPLQTEQTQVTIEISWDSMTAATGPFANPTEVTTFSAISATAYPTIEFFSVPVNPADRPAIDYLFQTIEDRKDVVAVGEQTLDLPRGNVYTKLFWWHYHNATRAPSTDITNVGLRYNQVERPVDVRANSLRSLNRDMYGRDIPAAHYVMDFNHQGLPNMGTARDYVNTAFITDVQLRPTIASGATLGSGTNRIQVVRQQLARIA